MVRSTRRPRIAMVVTRDLNEQVSRAHTMRQVRDALLQLADIDIIHYPSLVEQFRFGDFVIAVVLAATSLWLKIPLSLQVLAYRRPLATRRIIGHLRRGDYDAVYIDTVRSAYLANAIHASLRVPLIVDFDDLMSRRAAYLANSGHPLTLGFLEKRLPVSVVNALSYGWLARWIVRHEAKSLLPIEEALVRKSAATVLVSHAERDELAARLDGAFTGLVHACAPPSELHHRGDLTLKSPFRFVFVGSDRQLQNELSIRFLLDLWKSRRPSSVLHIYGAQTKKWERPENIIWHGFVNDLREAYDETSIVLVPTLRVGGIKTKIIEAWAYGRPVLTNGLGLEGIPVIEYPLCLELEDWGNVVVNPDVASANFAAGAAAGVACLSTCLSPARYRESWARIIKEILPTFQASGDRSAMEAA